MGPATILAPHNGPWHSHFTEIHLRPRPRARHWGSGDLSMGLCCRELKSLAEEIRLVLQGYKSRKKEVSVCFQQIKLVGKQASRSGSYRAKCQKNQ